MKLKPSPTITKNNFKVIWNMYRAVSILVGKSANFTFLNSRSIYSKFSVTTYIRPLTKKEEGQGQFSKQV